MKPVPKYDFPIGVWPEGANYPSAAATAFAGIYSVTLNHSTSIVFVPAIDRRSPWPPSLPEDIDRLVTPDEARRSMVALSSFVVTPDDDRAESIEAFSSADDEHVIFYVRSDEFDVLTRELRALHTQFSGIHDAVAVSKLGDSALGLLLLSRVVPSGHLSERELSLLGRRAETTEAKS